MAYPTAYKNHSLSLISRHSGVTSNTLTQFRPRSFAMYNPLTSYSNSHNQDWGTDSKKRVFYSETKHKNPSGKFERPHNPLKSDKSLLKSTHQFVASALLNKSIAASEINKPLDFTPEHFKTKTFFDAQVPVAAKTSNANVGWIKQEANRNHMEKIKRGDYIPSISHLDVYGRRKQPSKFEQYGLWISKSPFHLS